LEWIEGDPADLFFDEGMPDTDAGEGMSKDNAGERTPEDDTGEAARKHDAGMLDRIIERSLRKTIAMNPVNPFYHFSLGQHYVDIAESYSELHQQLKELR